MSSKLVFFIPAGGFGYRMRPLTEEFSKPALPVWFDERGYVYRLIELALSQCAKMNADVFIGISYQKSSLAFLEANSRIHFIPLVKSGLSRAFKTFTEFTQTYKIRRVIVMGSDMLVPHEILRGIAESMDEKTGVSVLCTAKKQVNSLHKRDPQGFLSNSLSDQVCSDIGVYAFDLDLAASRYAKFDDIPDFNMWKDVCYEQCPEKEGKRVKMYIHESDDLLHIDAGTPASYYELLMKLNRENINPETGNLIFPGAVVHPFSRNIIALPFSRSNKIILRNCIVPEMSEIGSMEETLQVRLSNTSFFPDTINAKDYFPYTWKTD